MFKWKYVVLFWFEMIKFIPIFVRFRTQRILQIDELIVLIVIKYFRRKCHKNKTRKSFVSFSLVSSSPFLSEESHLELVRFLFRFGLTQTCKGPKIWRKSYLSILALFPRSRYLSNNQLLANFSQKLHQDWFLFSLQ
jgi:hypothetical protein